MALSAPNFTCGFLCGSTHWNGGAGFSYATTGQRTGSQCARLNGTGSTGANGTNAIGGITASTIAVHRIYIKFDTLPNVSWKVFTEVNTNLGLYFNASNNKLTLNDNEAGVGTSGLLVPNTGQWYRIDMIINCSGANKTVDAKIDGQSFTQYVGSSGTATMNSFRIGSLTSVTVDMRFDDWIYSQGITDYPIGAGHVELWEPTADGGHTSTGSDIVKGTIATPVGASIINTTTDAFNWVNAFPGGKTDNTRLINQQTAASTEFVEVKFGPGTGFSAPTQSPRMVSVLTVDRQAGTQTCNYIIRLRDNATDSDIVNKGTVAGLASDTFTSKHYANPPSGGNWNVNGSGNGALNNLRARFGFSSDANPDVYWRGIILEAEFPDLAPIFTENIFVRQAINRASSF